MKRHVAWNPKLNNKSLRQVLKDYFKFFGKGVFLDAGSGGTGLKPSETLAGVVCGKMLANFKVLRLDIDKAMKPDILADIRDMHMVKSNSVDILGSAHTLEHVSEQDTHVALREFSRVLKPNGMAFIVCPDIHAAAVEIVKGNPYGTLYKSNAGEINAMDVFYGMSMLTATNEFMFHKTGFTSVMLLERLVENGFRVAAAWSADFNVVGLGWK